MKITALKAHARHKSRVRVFLDGEFAFDLAEIEAARLRLGQELDEASIARLRQADLLELAYERALKFLTTRPRSAAEVQRRLRKLDIEPTRIEAVVARLRRAGLVDDQAFAAYWVENREAFRPRSRRALKAELRRQGVTDEAVVERALQGTDDTQAAYRLAVRRVGRWPTLPYPEFRRRLAEFLARLGFDYETLEPVVERVWNELRAGAPEQ